VNIGQFVVADTQATKLIQPRSRTVTVDCRSATCSSHRAMWGGVTVTSCGNILHRWARIGEAGTSSSRGKAITRRGMCTCIATAS
jgi:hypothetical protein